MRFSSFILSLTCLCLFAFNCAAVAEEERPVKRPEEIVLYDMTGLFSLDLADAEQRRSFWDQTHLVTSLQGLVNRDAPQLYIRYNAAPDDFWLERLREKDGWLDGIPVTRIETLEALLQRYSSYYSGAVVWDERVPATSNLASSIAGYDNLLCLRYDTRTGSLYQRLVKTGPRLKVDKQLLADGGGPLFTGAGRIPGTDLASTGSAKNDAYRWLIAHYIDTGRTNPHSIGYYLDGYWLECWDQGAPQNHTVTNHDFVIARRGTFFDLNVWDDETTVDDRNQKPGTDADTLRTFLHALYRQFEGDGVIHAAGFVPWAYKYTDHGQAGGTHRAVPTEWKYAEILSCFNAYMDADALGYSAMANASFYQHYPLPKRIPQNPKPTAASLKKRGILDKDGRIVPKRYVAHYVGDYDSAAWLYWSIPKVWMDEERGKVPLSWAFNPNLAERMPLCMAWTRATRTENDFFIAGDSGAGYLNPGLLSEPRWHSDLPSGVAVWERHCKKYFEQWDISVTGFVIDGFGPGLPEEGLDAYARFSPDGIVAQKIPLQGIHKGMPYTRMRTDLSRDAREAARAIVGLTGGRTPQFVVARSILMSPSWYLEVSEELERIAGDEIQVVDLYTLFWLIREAESDPETYAAPPSSYADKTSVQAAPGAEEGLRAVYIADGPFRVATVEGSQAWKADEKKTFRYLYFDVDDSFSKSAGAHCELDIEYLDNGHGEFVLQYDSNDRNAGFGGSYKDMDPILRKNTSTWKTKTYRIDDAKFSNAQNGGTDFRFCNKGETLWIRKVTVRRVR